MPSCWALLALVAGDLLVRARARRELALPDAVLAALFTAGAFGLTYGLLDGLYPNWMGLYTVLLSAATLGLWAILRRRDDAGAVAAGYLLQSLVLLFLAVPIQFNGIATTFGWAGLGLVLLLLVRHTRSVLLAGAMLVGLFLALAHFEGVALVTDASLRETAFLLAGAAVPVGVLAALGLAVACLASQWALHVRPALFAQADRIAMAVGLAGAGVFALEVSRQLPPSLAVGAMLAGALALLLIGRAGRRPDVGVVAAALLGVGALLLAVETLNGRPDLQIESLSVGPVVLCRGLWLAVATLAICTAAERLLPLRCLRKQGLPAFPTLLGSAVFAAVAIRLCPEPAVASAWLLAATAALLAVNQPRPCKGRWAGAALLACLGAGKWMLYDTLSLRLSSGPGADAMSWLNARFADGIAWVVLLTWMMVQGRRFSQWLILNARPAAWVVGSLAILWGGLVRGRPPCASLPSPGRPGQGPPDGPEPLVVARRDGAAGGRLRATHARRPIRGHRPVWTDAPEGLPRRHGRRPGRLPDTLVHRPRRAAARRVPEYTTRPSRPSRTPPQEEDHGS